MNALFQPCRAATFQVPRERPLTIDARGGELAVLHGRVWLTRASDPLDYVLEAGERIHVDAHRQVVVSAWDRSEWPTLAWQPDARDPAAAHFGWRALRVGAFAALALLASGTAAALRRAEAGFAALARSAASSANRAQGCI